MIRLLAAVASLASLAPLTLTAQDTYGGIEGVVRLPSGDAVVGADVTVSGPALIRPRSAVTDQTGRYRLLALPVARYTIVVRQVGMRPVTLSQVPVELGALTSADPVTLAPLAIELAPIEVSGRPVIDFASAQFGAHLERSEFELIPSGRSFRDLLRLAPFTTESPHGDGTNIVGATGIENMYFVDGVNTTDPYLAATSTQLPRDFVEVVEVREGGFEAEYGRSTGGIINVVTRSGGDQWHGTVFGNFNNQALTAEELIGVGGRRSSGANVYDFGADAGGPLVRNRLWFYGAYDPTFTRRDVGVARFGLFPDERVDHLFAGKLTWSPQADTRVVLSVLGDITRADRVRPGPFTNPDSLLGAGPLLNRYEDGGISTSLVLTRDFGGAWLLEASLGVQTRNLYDGPGAGDDSARVSQIVSVDSQTIEVMSGGFGEWLDARSRRASGRMAVTRFAGRHAVKAGVELETTSSTERNGNAAPGVVIALLDTPDDPVACRAGPSDSTCRYLVIALTPQDAPIAGRFPAAFLQDTWRATDRLTLLAGLRWDGQYWVGTDGNVAQRITNQWQPRLGVTFDLRGDGKQRLSASAGRFYQQTALRLVDNVANTVTENDLVYWDGDPFAGGQPVAGSGFPLCCSIMDSNIQGTHSDELSLGYDGLVSRRLRLGIRGVYRTLREAIQPGDCGSVDPMYPIQCPPGAARIAGNPGSGALRFLDPVRRVYRGFEVMAELVGDPRNALHVSYVLSRNSGNYPGAHDQDVGNFFFPSDNRAYWYPSQMPNNSGPLPNDHTHTLKAWGAHAFSDAFGVGAFLQLQTGAPRSRLGLVPGPGIATTFLTPRGSEGRLPTVWTLDLRGTYRFDAFGPVRMTLDVLNVANRRTALAVQNLFQRELGGTSPNWGQPTAYQSPRTIRVGMKAEF